MVGGHGKIVWAKEKDPCHYFGQKVNFCSAYEP